MGRQPNCPGEPIPLHSLAACERHPAHSSTPVDQELTVGCFQLTGAPASSSLVASAMFPTPAASQSASPISSALIVASAMSSGLRDVPASNRGLRLFFWLCHLVFARHHDGSTGPGAACCAVGPLPPTVPSRGSGAGSGQRSQAGPWDETPALLGGFVVSHSCSDKLAVQEPSRPLQAHESWVRVCLSSFLFSARLSQCRHCRSPLQRDACKRFRRLVTWPFTASWTGPTDSSQRSGAMASRAPVVCDACGGVWGRAGQAVECGGGEALARFSGKAAASCPASRVLLGAARVR